MKTRRIFGLAVIAVCVSVSVPAILSAQSQGAEPQVTVTLLGSGHFRITGDFRLETPDRAASIYGPEVEFSEQAKEQLAARGISAQTVTDYGQGMTVELWGWVVDAESGAMGFAVGPSQIVHMRNAEVTRAD